MILFLICSFVHLIVLSIVHQFSGSVVFQRYDHYLRPVENPDRKDTVSQAPAYKHRSSVFRVGAACIFRKEPLIRRDEPSSYKWKPELAAKIPPFLWRFHNYCINCCPYYRASQAVYQYVNIFIIDIYIKIIIYILHYLYNIMSPFFFAKSFWIGAAKKGSQV